MLTANPTEFSAGWGEVLAIDPDKTSVPDLSQSRTQV